MIAIISCTQFIPAYSEGFKFLEDRGGKGEVLAFWNYLSDNYLKDSLKKLVKEQGIKGCFTYWSGSLNEEAADFTMTLNEEKGIYNLKMHKCPSKQMLIDLKYMDPYPDYCDHCEALYSRVVRPWGFEYIQDNSRCDEASCEVTIKSNGGSKNG